MTGVRVSREELYRQVWQSPMSKLAGKYGITGNGLAKICDRLRIPYPPRGYWAKKAAGHSVQKMPLPAAGNDIPNEALISPSLPKTQPLVPDQLVVKRILETKVRIADPLVSRRAARLHPIVSGWKEEHARALKEHRQSRIALWPAPPPFSDADLRRHDLLNILFRMLEAQAGRVSLGERQELRCEMNGEVVTFQLREKHKRLPKPSVLKQGFKKDVEEYSWRSNLKPTGQFVFSIKTLLPGNLRQEWHETTETPMEELLPEIAAVFVTASPLLVEQRKRRAEDERQRQIAERQRYEENERRKLDRNRWRRLIEMARQHEEVVLVRTFLAALKSADAVEGDAAADLSLNDWISWAEEWIEKGDPLSSGAKGVFEDVARVTNWSYRD